MCQNVPFCIKRQWNYLHKHSQKNQFGYLGFDRTGSVPLHIYGDDIIRSRWERPHWTKQSPENYQALVRIAKQCQNEGIAFYFVIQPYRKALIDHYPKIRTTLLQFDHNTTRIVTAEGGKVLRLYQTLPLDDSHFADRSHLNDKGSRASTEAIAAFLNKQTQP
jgi:poly-D-alanine transfer protein DltD